MNNPEEYQRKSLDRVKSKTVKKPCQYPELGDCWEYTGAITSTGYGQSWMNGKVMTAHRAMWTLTFGPIPEKMFVCHKCDNRKCCNPEHLFLGTQKDNIQDMFKKGRGWEGDKNYMRKIQKKYGEAATNQKQSSPRN